MKDQNSQQANGAEQGGDNKKKEGHVKCLRWIELDLCGANSPIPDKWRVFLFIKYRIQDTKRTTQRERISKDLILKNTGIFHKNFNRIISSLEKEGMIQVKRGNYRDNIATYSLDPIRFPGDVIVPDRKKVIIRPVESKSQNEVTDDASKLQNEVTPEMKLQNEVTELQNEAEADVSTSKSLGVHPFRASSSRASEDINPRSLLTDGEQKESFTRLGRGQKTDKKQTSPDELKLQTRWLKETNGIGSYDEWKQKRLKAFLEGGV